MPSFVVAEELSSEARLVLKAISKKYQALGSWQASVSEERVSSGLGGMPQFSTGHIYFARPDRFRYEIKSEPSTLAISDGRQFWFGKFPKGLEKPGVVKHFKSIKGVELDKYLAFLRGIEIKTKEDEKKLLNDFKVQAKYEKTQLRLKLSPKASNEILYIQMEFLQTQNHPARVVIEDVIGTKTTLKIIEASTMDKVNPKLFAPEFSQNTKIETL